MAEQIEKRKRILSGIQPTGIPTLGNYIGAVRNWALLQSDYDCLYMVADLHALTVRQTPANLRRQTREMAALLLAVGIDPEQHVLFVQSHVPAHCELSWVLACNTQFGELSRMTQFKDKSAKHPDNVNGGLFTYPVLMAADILIYNADLVPVGIDQKQHLELANDIAQKFNHDYGVDFFPNIEPLIQGVAARVMSLRDGSKKMSKSDPSDQSRINLTDDADTISQKIKRAKTDPEPLPEHMAGLEGRPEARNLVGILAAITGTMPENVLREHGGQGFGAFKSTLADALIAHLSPIATEMKRLLEDEAALDAALRLGAERAGAIAEPIVAKARDIVGFLPSR